MFSKKVTLLLFAALLMGLIAACGTQPTPETVTVVETVEVVKEVPAAPVNPDAGKVKLDTVVSTEPPSLDPSLGTDTTSIFFIRQMFEGLTSFDSKANVVPALATEWSASDDGLIWTFKMRDDVHWVHRDPTTGEYEDLGPVTAQDVEYGVKRTLDPNTASDYSYVLYIIDGAEAFNTNADSEKAEELRDAVGVKAVDDTTVQFTLASPAAYFPSIAAMWVTFPQPQATIEQWGNNWTEAGLIVTNGPYTLREWTHGASIMIEKNPLWVDAADVQIDLFGGPIIQEASTAMSLYENNEIDMMSDQPGWGPPLPDMDRIKADAQLSKELLIAPQLCTYYYGFVNNKPPFDDPILRKAFAAAIDRQSLIDNVVKGDQIPAHSFAPPGIFGNVADDKTIGSFLVESNFGDQVAQAQQWIAEAGYPEGEGLDVLLMHNTSEAHAQIAQAIQAMWQESFPKANIKIENQEWAVYLKTLLPESPVEEKPNIFRMGWCADYPDSNNWLNEVLNSKSGQNYSNFNNPEFDKLVEAAALEPDPAKRQEMYKQAEDILVDKDTSIAPIYYYTYVRLYKPWVTPVLSPVSGDPIAEWKIDVDAKMKARGQ
jgi:oligopeptide transport system substrate-binding protein